MSDIREGTDVAEWVREYKIEAFVETGCFEGTTLRFADTLGLELYSCDLNEDYVKDCLAQTPHATIYTGDSREFLKVYLPKIEKRSWFWLDAHYPWLYQRPKLFTFENYFPLFAELELIKTLKKDYHKDMILCDDIGNIEAPDNPLYDAKALAVEALPAKGHLLQEYKDLFKDTHEVVLASSGCGLLAFLPKEKPSEG